MNEIFKLFGSIGLHTDEAEDGLEKVHKKGESAAGNITGFFKKAAIGIGAVFAAGKVIDFGKQTVEAAADAQAIRGQYEQVFGNMTGDADKMSQNMAQKFGMIPEQLTPGMIKFQSMFRGVGIDTKKAMDMTKDATTAAADASKFANVSYADAQASIQSFILGNYEAGDAIGVQANDNAVAQYAIQQGAVKTTAEWQKMGDAQKEQMRLGFITHVQKLSGVTGQAGREANSYEAVTEKLGATWQKFLATVGAPILAAVIPILGAVGNAVGYLTNLFSGAASKTDPLAMAIKALMSTFSFLGTVISNIIKPVFDSFFTGSMQQGKNMLFDLVMGVQNGVMQIALFFARYSPQIQQIVRTTFTVIQTVVGTAINIIRTVIGAFFQYVVPFISQMVGQIVAFWKANGTQIMQAVTIVFNTIKGIINAVMPYLVNFIRGTWNNIKGIIQGVVNIIQGIIQVFSGVMRGDWSAIWNGIQSICRGAGQVVQAIFSQMINVVKNTVMGGLNGVKSLFGSILGGIGNLVSNAFNGAVNAAKGALDNMVQTVRNGIDWVKNLFNFHIEFPSFHMPSFHVSGGSANPLDWVQGKGIPKLEFYAKGGIMNNPTAFGMNGDSLMVGGEAGQEAVLPLNRNTLGMIGDKISANMQGSGTEEIVAAIREMAERIVAAVIAAGNINIDGQALTDHVENLLMKGITV